MLAPFINFTARFELVFVLHWKTLFLRGLILKQTERACALLKNGFRDFQNSPPFERSFSCDNHWKF